MADPKEITVDFMFGLGGKAGDAIFKPVQDALLDAFRQAGNIDDLATRLAIPIQMVTVTGARVVTAHGYDAYKITVAIRSGDPNLVAKEIFSSGVGIAAGPLGAGASRVLGTGATFIPFVGPAIGTVLRVGAPIAGVLTGIGASEYAKGVWDDYIATSSTGQWVTGEIANVGVGLKVTPALPLPSVPVINDVPALDQAPRSILMVDPTDNQAKIVFNSRSTIDPNVPNGANTYVVQRGDSLWKIAQTNGWDFEQLKAINPQISDPNFIRIDQRINTPAPVLTASRFDIVTNPRLDFWLTNPPDPSTSVNSDNRTLVSHSGYDILGIGNVNTLSGNYAYANDLLSNAFRPGSQSLTTHILGTSLAENFRANPELVNSVVWKPEVKAAALNYLGMGVQNAIPTDPLVLDLNGDGVRLTSFGEAPVLFDIDHDGGSKELTGWVNAEDGIVVMDIDDDGVIDGIHETMSEYFNGTAGTDGESGSKPFADGFAALKSLDSNGDNRFTSADTAWNNVKVWVDADHDGQTDTGELKTFASLGITSINLLAAAQSGLINGGNEVLATGSFVMAGQTREAQAARFIANPAGNTSSAVGGGANVSSEDGQSTHVSALTTGATLDAAALGVANVYGNVGNDVLIGTAGANWLVGGQGSDSFDAGDGDDMLIIDAADLQQNIDAGDGFDMVQVVGSEGVTLNMAQAGVEVVAGGTGDDIFIGGGRSSVFVRADDGDDIVIGGAANDGLSGENGNDLIDGGAGNDVIRGGRGQDQLLGGSGDDLIEGGQDDDRLAGGDGNDVLKGQQGDDSLDGGEGTDMAEFSGSFADYRITRLSDTAWRVVDTKAGRDGADMLTNIEKLNFADVSAVDITLDNPFPVQDVITIADRSGPKLIKVADLLANDRDWQADTLRITTLSDVIGGTVAGTYNATTKEWTPTLTAAGELTFTPTAGFTGVMSFKYKIADTDGTPGATAFQVGTSNAAEMRGQVFIKTPDMPIDSAFTEQWYLSDINVIPVWQDYTGKGVRVGVFETSGPFSAGATTFDYRHPDLSPSTDTAWLNDPAHPVATDFSQHATLVAGVIAASRNGEGVVGVAYGAKLSGYTVNTSFDATTSTSPLSVSDVEAAMAHLKNFDVVNNSWGVTDDFAPVYSLQPVLLTSLALGRNGLGTVIVVAGGNDRQSGGNTNYDFLSANRASIVTGAINAQGDISTLTIGQTPFSAPGASILVSAPGSNVESTSRLLMNDDGTAFGSDTSTTEGTSFATPVVSGVVALMLEANPDLGWRDVQQILALTARKVNDPNTDTVWNAARNWNGGGMHTSHDYGFGQVDARAAVRLAETWQGQHTLYNERQLQNAEGSLASGTGLGLAIADGSVITRTLSLGAGLRIENVGISLDVTHSNWGDLTVELIAPSGVISKLVANPGTSASSPGGNASSGQLLYSFNTTHDYGENAQGNWQLRITDRSGRGGGVLNGWRIDAYGSDLNETAAGVYLDDIAPIISAVGDDVYFYTDEFTSAPGTSRASLTDTNGGNDTINAAAVSSGSVINLNNGSSSTIAGRALTINGNIEFAFGGDGNDTLTGNALSNLLKGGRGADTLSGGDGVDFLDGGKGNDIYAGGAGSDLFVIYKDDGSTDTVNDFSATAGNEKILLVGFSHITDFSQISTVQEGANTRLLLGGGQSVLLKNVSPGQISEQNFAFFSDALMLDRYLAYFGNPLSWIGTNGAEVGLLPSNLGDLSIFALGGNDELGATTTNDLLDGGDGNDILVGDNGSVAPGADWLQGGAGHDLLGGGDGSDYLTGGSGNDELHGGNGDDVLAGDTGNDVLFGEDGNDVLIGGSGQDHLNGGAGDDLIVLDGDLGTVSGSNFEFYGTRIGGAGADVFRLARDGTGTGGISFFENSVTADNLIADFDPGQTGEVLDLSEIDWIRGFEDLTISTLTVNGVANTSVSADDGNGQTLYVTMRGVSAAQLNASHFKFAEVPGLVRGSPTDDDLYGNAGANQMDGGLGADFMSGRTGDDTYLVDNAGDTVDELPDGGVDTVRSAVSYALSANVENLVLVGTAAIDGTGNALANRITGNAADNVLDGQGGADTLLGGAGNDTYLVDNQSDSILELAGEGVDTVHSSVSYTLGREIENLVLSGIDGINATGNSLDNFITGNAGDNILDGAGGSDTLAGGFGNDIYIVDSSGDLVVEALSAGQDTVYSSINLTLSANIENLVLMPGAVSGTGNDLDNALTGNSGNNVLTGGAGNDWLDGGAGNDTLVGGTGDDTYVVDSVLDVINENAAEGSDTVITQGSWTLGANLENLTLAGTAAINGTGNALANTLTGNSSANTLDGGSGADTMRGGLGNDIYLVDDIGDVVTENTNEGTDLVQSAISYTLGSNVENLTLTGTAAINGTGNALNNVLTGNSGANVLSGGDGNDVLVGGGGADIMMGGAGHDTYYVDNVGDAVTEQVAEGIDGVFSAITQTLGANVENLTLTGTAAINGTGNELDNVLTGNSAANVLDGGAGIDTLIGGAGNDTYVVDNSADSIVENANEGTDLVQSSASYTLSANVENLTLTGTAAINATGNSSSNILTGNAGNNVLDGGAGTDTLVGGAGDDTYVVDVATDVVTEAASAGLDTILSSVTYTASANVENLTLTGTAAINATGNALNNVLVGNAASNLLDGGAGSDSLSGGDGNDTYVVDNVADVVIENANQGIDLIQSSVTFALSANVENLTLTGTGVINGTGNELDNVLTGNSVANVLTAGAGNDTLNGGAGSDTLIGGTGNDTYVVDVSTDVITEYAGEGTDLVQSAATYTLSANVENLTLTGTAIINGTGNTLDNIIVGNSAANTLTGGAGNDTLDGGAGTDAFNGGAGDDTFIVDVTTEVVTEALNEGTDTVMASVSYTLGANVENLTLTGTAAINATGNTLANILIGNSANNTLNGGAGNDTLDGGAGADQLIGGAGDDVFRIDNVADVVIEGVDEGWDRIESSINLSLALNIEELVLVGNATIGIGNSQSNRIVGNALDNTLEGSIGADALLGGTGNDTYRFSKGDGVDTITDNDATAGNLDIVEFTNVASTEVTALNRVGNDLVLSYGVSDSVRVAGYFTDASRQIEQFKFSNGVTWTDANIKATVITNGTAGIDSITGYNGGTNRIYGQDGDDSLTGGNQADLIDGGAGADSMTGGLGNDTYVVDSASDQVIENANAGIDTVRSSITYTLGNEVENLVLTGSSPLDGRGNALENHLVGNSAANTLYGDAAGTNGNTAPLTSLSVFARGSVALGAAPLMEVWIDGVKAQTFEVSSTTTQEYVVSAANLPAAAAHRVDVVFTNDAYDAATGQDR
ncbi:S8 family serine peptidase, partial [Methyloversatilis discipulorum]|uniref:S8 family serine peptidase n=1 Tax=Methyloversatilis discipulorum TaxID=1119528 RepID=UPI00313823FF